MLLNDVFVNVIYGKIMLCMLERDIVWQNVVIDEANISGFSHTDDI